MEAAKAKFDGTKGFCESGIVVNCNACLIAIIAIYAGVPTTKVEFKLLREFGAIIKPALNCGVFVALCNAMKAIVIHKGHVG